MSVLVQETSPRHALVVHILYRGECFLETAEGLHDVLQRLGLASTISALAPGAEATPPWSEAFSNHLLLFIVLGGHLFEELPTTGILVNYEQMSSPWMTETYCAALRSAAVVCDFSDRNLSTLVQSLQLRQPCYTLPVYVPADAFQILPGAGSSDNEGDDCVDVLFYGCANARRTEMLRRLSAAGLRAEFHFEYALFGPERARAMARARVVLNLHYYEDAALEVHRLAPLLAAGCCVVSEPSADQELDARFRSAVAFARYDDIPAVVSWLSRSDDSSGGGSRSGRSGADWPGGWGCSGGGGSSGSSARRTLQAAARKLAVAMQDDISPLSNAVAALAATAVARATESQAL
ncbi:hypothetical protein JKP88DRAFT_169726 [Tribonema minus]|uniref:Uncharacterized protein n=1 Tax=Tribonema minus TaxID=303371 RepID=A0A835YVC7_9STRA|nr:hypothetical protein JKP88DRAFT_169726 [Tribonema minus]